MKIGIVNDMPIAREAIRRAVASNPSIEIAWVANDGAEAIERALKCKPDLILMDLFMPVLDGVEATRRIMAQNPCPILIVTSTVGGHMGKVYEAMGFGALDAVDTPTFGRDQDLVGGQPLLKKIETIAKLIGAHKKDQTKDYPAVKAAAGRVATPPLIAIGASTGGPAAVAEILGALPKGQRSTVILVQHIDSTLARGLAEWLSDKTGHPVKIATAGHPVAPGEFLLSGTNDHMVLREGLRLDYAKEPEELSYRPSVNLFFESLKRHWPSPGVAVLLTGMGGDGAKGLLDLRKSGWLTIAQDEATSVVYGMPREAAKLGAASHILPIQRIGTTIRDHLALTLRSKDHA